MTVLRRTNQGGSTAVFVVVGVVLLIALVASVYFVKIYGEQARKDQAIATYEKQKSDQAKSEADKKAKESKATEPGVNKSDQVATTNIPATGVSSTTDLPATGPGMLISQLIGISLMTIAISAYVASRRDLVRYL